MPISATYFRDGEHPQRVSVAGISEALGEHTGVLWVDVAEPTHDDVGLLARIFTLHPLAAEDLLRGHQRPKVDDYGDTLVAVAYGARVVEERLELSEVAMVAGRRHLVTVRHRPLHDLAAARRRLEAADGRRRDGPGFLLYAVLDELVDSYLPVLHRFGERIDQIEAVLLSERYERRRLAAAFALRRDMLALRGVAGPLDDMLDTICRRDRSIVARDLDAELRDVRDHVIRAVERLDRFDSLLQSSTNLYLSGVSADLNDVVLKVSSWAAILVAPTLIASIYGMNFRVMPELHWHYGYGYALGLMAALALALWIAFRRSGWL